MSVCALIVSLYLYRRDVTEGGIVEDKELLALLASISIILFSSIARLASAGTVIILQRDWVVVITNGDSDMLASKIVIIS